MYIKVIHQNKDCSQKVKRTENHRIQYIYARANRILLKTINNFFIRIHFFYSYTKYATI